MINSQTNDKNSWSAIVIGIILIALGTLCSEVATSFGKRAVHQKNEGIFTMGFINSWMATLAFGVVILFGAEFYFSVASLPTFLPRVFLEILQTTITLYAIVLAERSLFTSVRTITIPLIILVDTFVLGTVISPAVRIGALIIIGTILFISRSSTVRRTGLGLVLLTSFNAVITTALYKYNITHFNSVAAEQGIIQFINLLYLGAFALWYERTLLFRQLFQFKTSSRSLLGGVGSVLESYAMQYAPASVVMTAKRGMEMVWSLMFGRILFCEGQLFRKMGVAMVISAGLVLLAMA